MKHYDIKFYDIKKLGKTAYKIRNFKTIEAESFQDARRKLRLTNPTCTGLEIKENKDDR